MAIRLIKNILENFTPEKVKNFYAERTVKKIDSRLEYVTFSYAQEGEDLILNRFLENKEKGFYIDIGAHHPKRFSNTYIFYKKGWEGINIDAMPGSMKAFEQERPRDINLELGVSKEKKELTYYIFNEPALNTFSKTEAEKKDGLNNYRIVEQKKILTFPLVDILSKHIINNSSIDFMSIDVEGLDLEVLQSNDWKKYRPTLLLVEDLKKQSLAEFQNSSPVFHFLKEKNYELVAKTFNTLFFKDKTV